MNDMFGLQDIREAHHRVGRYIKKTPLEYSERLSETFQSEVFLKLENRQFTNSFKVRGALNKMAQLTPEEKQRGVVTASSGNHGLGVAFASRVLEIPATIFLPDNVTATKLQRLREYDVNIIQSGGYDEVESAAQEFSKKQDRVYVSPYNDYEVMAGQGTIALEINEGVREYDLVIVPVGGGGLIAGISRGIKDLNPSAEILGVVTPGASTMYHSFRAREVVEVEEFETMAEAFLGGVEKDSKTLDVILECVDDILVVSEHSVKEAMRLLWSEKGEVVEGAGATGVGLVLEEPELFHEKKSVIVISGGNISETRFNEIVKSPQAD